MEVAGRRVLVIGAGRTGSAVTRELARRDSVVTLLESGSAEAQAAAEQIAAPGVTVMVDAGRVEPSDFDLIVPSPGVVEHHPLLVAAICSAIGFTLYQQSIT